MTNLPFASLRMMTRSGSVTVWVGNPDAAQVTDDRPHKARSSHLEHVRGFDIALYQL